MKDTMCVLYSEWDGLGTEICRKNGDVFTLREGFYSVCVLPAGCC